MLTLGLPNQQDCVLSLTSPAPPKSKNNRTPSVKWAPGETGPLRTTTSEPARDPTRDPPVPTADPQDQWIVAMYSLSTSSLSWLLGYGRGGAHQGHTATESLVPPAQGRLRASKQSKTFKPSRAPQDPRLTPRRGAALLTTGSWARPLPSFRASASPCTEGRTGPARTALTSHTPRAHTAHRSRREGEGEASWVYRFIDHPEGCCRGRRGRPYLRYQILSFFSRLIFFCSCRMPYSRASAVGGQPVGGTVPQFPCWQGGGGAHPGPWEGSQGPPRPVTGLWDLCLSSLLGPRAHPLPLGKGCLAQDGQRARPDAAAGGQTGPWDEEGAAEPRLREV